MTLHNSELLRQHEAHAARRTRLMSPPVRVHRDTLEGLRISLREMTEAFEKVSSEREVLQKKIALEERYSRRMELDVADRNARILALSQRVCELEDLGITSVGKRSVAEIVSEVLNEFPGITWEDIKGIRRQKNLVVPRQRCMYEVARQRHDISLPRIGKIFGGRDHSTICHAVKKVRLEREGGTISQDWHDRQEMAAKRGSPKPLMAIDAALTEGKG